ncbi:hypothetical protein H206_02147 [Candidatus Electrothrix aarhusensis]|uniref:Uncharacterized protein n=1 Tax=Candidatus Electrothrix aarhusensis TaxID=1859131 RepID=A0A3S3R6H1_9BACT|nr:hypothetical protein H206_02147 [Candidatus Electrothrix aarhusensis]
MPNTLLRKHRWKMLITYASEGGTGRLLNRCWRAGAKFFRECILQLDHSSGHMLDLPAQLGKLLKSFMAGTRKEFSFSCPCPKCPGALVFEEGCEVYRECGKDNLP